MAKNIGTSLEQVLTDAESLSTEDQVILEELLHKRRVETWRRETAASARTAMKAVRAGKLKPEPVESVIKRLRDTR